ncbi:MULTISPECIES: hypothetical protein [Aphanothece]|uniref:hypothetical protein n=1 Tax=Aphanothece TaxID=1121 RepID=UPI003984F35C
MPSRHPVVHPAALATSTALALLMALSLAGSPGAALADSQPTLLQQLRELIGYNPRQAVGGSRSGSAASVCLITPRFADRADGVPQAVVALPSPTLLAAGALNEVRLQQNGRILWQRRTSSSEPIEGPIAWPLPPLRPGETMLLRLRPRGAAGSDFADIQLVAAGEAEQQRALSLLGDPTSRLEVIEREARAGNTALASELLFSPLEQPPEGLTELQQLLITQACGITPAGP